MKSTSGLSATSRRVEVFEIPPYVAVFREREAPARGELPLDICFYHRLTPVDARLGAVRVDIGIISRLMDIVSEKLAEYRARQRASDASLPEGILAASSTTKSYRVDGRDDYQIEFIAQSDGKIDMYARQHPSDPWGKSVVENHLYDDHKICVSSGKEPRTLDRAKAIAMVWCNGWSEYCRTGTFPKGGRRVDV